MLLDLSKSDIVCVGITIPGSSGGYIESRVVTHIDKDGVWVVDSTTSHPIRAHLKICEQDKQDRTSRPTG